MLDRCKDRKSLTRVSEFPGLGVSQEDKDTNQKFLLNHRSYNTNHFSRGKSFILMQLKLPFVFVIECDVHQGTTTSDDRTIVGRLPYWCQCLP